MKKLTHKTASSDHYDNAAKEYDLFNEKDRKITNITLANILEKYDVESVLDVTYGTGSQVFYLTDLGFDVTGSDISFKMLEVAIKSH